ncbi:ABC transporter ATP-binding protein [Variovorax sp. PDNC026]|uniref:ABC transporter ATP-binding protein n=1 Tax=Variovorax sp. PDNC026 TaxID=2811425 RepID=UPI0019668C97|nr:ABC transporter ATP-binding protein [Variovorax sp. PDNC026]QRY31844.1 ABC transporter ATP-binding protein [Variovorax sp. PDNC026]
MLKVCGLHAFYGKSHVLHGLDFHVRAGEIVSLLGRNGSGRSTTARAIMGLVRCEGSVRWKERELIGLAAFRIARAGIGYVPESRDVFPRLTVRENLLLGQRRDPSPGRWTLDDMYGLFPRLAERQHTQAGVMSGGEQQMLTMCRALMGNPELMLIDEPTEGLAPQNVELIGDFLRRLRDRGMSVLLIEQKLGLALRISDRVLALGHGQVVFDGTPEALTRDAAVRKEWLEV